jgi:hypothetical protein
MTSSGTPSPAAMALSEAAEPVFLPASMSAQSCTSPVCKNTLCALKNVLGRAADEFSSRWSRIGRSSNMSGNRVADKRTGGAERATARLLSSSLPTQLRVRRSHQVLWRREEATCDCRTPWGATFLTELLPDQISATMQPALNSLDRSADFVRRLFRRKFLHLPQDDHVAVNLGQCHDRAREIES